MSQPPPRSAPFPFYDSPTLSKVVDVGALAASADPNVLLVTYALGSCVGVCLYDNEARVAGLLHAQLPESSLDRSRAVTQPGLFVDTGVPALISRMTALGASPSRIRARIAGAAQLLGDRTLFDVGRKNQAAALAALLRQGITPLSQDCGGTEPRTLYLHVATGNLRMRRGARGAEAA